MSVLSCESGGFQQGGLGGRAIRRRHSAGWCAVEMIDGGGDVSAVGAGAAIRAGGRRNPGRTAVRHDRRCCTPTGSRSAVARPAVGTRCGLPREMGLPEPVGDGQGRMPRVRSYPDMATFAAGEKPSGIDEVVPTTKLLRPTSITWET